MYCKFCGAELPENAVICTRCGAAVDPEISREAQNRPEGPQRGPDMAGAPVPRSQNSGNYVPPFVQMPASPQDEIRRTANKTLAWGIASVAFAMTLYLSVLGVIFAALGFSKAKQFRRLAGPETGSALAGKILSIIGMCTGIVMMLVFFAVMGYVAYSMLY